MKITFSKLLILSTLVSSPVFADTDDYEKSINDKYGDGMLVDLIEELPEVLDFFVPDHKVEISYLDNDGREIRKVLTYEISGFLGESEQHSYYRDRDRDEEASGLLRFGLKIKAEDGSSVSLEEAKLALGQIDFQNGLIYTFIEYIDRKHGTDYSTRALDEYALLNLIELKLADKLYTAENGNALVFNGTFGGGAFKHKEAYGVRDRSALRDSTQFSYSSAIGYKFKNAIAGAAITPEVFHKGMNVSGKKDINIAKTGFQLSLEKALGEYSGCSAAIGFAKESVDGDFTEDSEEFFVKTKCEF